MDIKFTDKINKETVGMMNLIIYSVTKKEIQSQSIERINKSISVLRENLKNSCGKLMVIFDGYNQDSREIYEIDEIRNYVSKLFNNNQDLFYYLTNISQNSKLMLACMGDIKQIKRKDSSIVSLAYKPSQIIEKKVIAGVLECVNGDIEQTIRILKNLFL